MEKKKLSLIELEIKLEITRGNHLEAFNRLKSISSVLSPSHPSRIIISEQTNDLVKEMHELVAIIEELKKNI